MKVIIPCSLLPSILPIIVLQISSNIWLQKELYVVGELGIFHFI